MTEDTRSGDAPPLISATDLRTFLIADIRGYTRFTQERGDEAASDLAARFAEIVRETVPGLSGELLELRGDEAVCVFGSARQALRASIELQRRLRTPNADGWVFPLGVGIGLDAGEAVPTEGGYRGAALNVAARFCASAKPGEILATDTVVRLAGRMNGVRLVESGRVRAKGVDRPLSAWTISSEAPLPPLPPLRRSEHPRRFSTPAMVAVISIVLVVAAVLVALLVMGGSGREPKANVVLRSNSVVVIDLKGGRIVKDVPAGHGAGPIAVDKSSVWVGDTTASALTEINPSTYQAHPVGVGITPSTLAAGGGSAWITNISAGQVVQVVDGSHNVYPHHLPHCPTTTICASGIAYAANKVWVGYGGPGPFAGTQGVVRAFNPATWRIKTTIRNVPADQLTAGEGGVWAYGSFGFWVTGITLPNGPRIHPLRLPPNDAQGVYSHPGIAAGLGYVWAVSPAVNAVYRILTTNRLDKTIPIGTGGSDVAVGPHAVWVTDGNDLLKINPFTTRIMATYRLGHPANSVAVGDGRVWVTLQGS